MPEYLAMFTRAPPRLSRLPISALGLDVQPGVVSEDIVERGLRSNLPLEFCRGADDLDSSVVHECKAVTKVVRLFHVVSRYKDCHMTGFAQRADITPDSVPGERIKPHRGLVHHQDLWPMQHALGDFEASDHSARVMLHQTVCIAGQIRHGERLGDSLCALPARDYVEAG